MVCTQSRWSGNVPCDISGLVVRTGNTNVGIGCRAGQVRAATAG